MKSKYIALSLFLLPFTFFLFPSLAKAECTTQYGGGQYSSTGCTPNDLLVNKEVANPITGSFVENLTTTDATFSPGSDVLFRLTIKNQSGETFNPVTVKDVLPDFLTFVAGPGVYDKTNKTLTFTLENLIAGETRRIEIMTKVLDKSAFPAGKSFFCVTNYVKITAPARPDGDDDTAQACIQTSVLGAKTLPVAGFNDMALLLPFMGVGLSGIALMLKKK